MNKETAHLYLPLVQALADGETIQMRGYDELEFADVTSGEIDFSLEPECYRVKPKPKMSWYRVAEFNNGESTYAFVQNPESHDISGDKSFVRWLTGRIEYEVTA